LLTYGGCTAFPVSARRGFTTAIWCYTRKRLARMTGAAIAAAFEHPAELLQQLIVTL